MSLPSATPSASLLANLRAELMRLAPFAQMAPQHVERFIAASTQAYFAPGETVLSPERWPGRGSSTWYARAASPAVAAWPRPRADSSSRPATSSRSAR